MFFAFPGEGRWNADHEALEFAVGIGEYNGVVRVPRAVFRQLLGHTPTPPQCVEAYYRERTAFEIAAEAKLRARLLTADGNVEITGRDLRGSQFSTLSACGGKG
jgi:redox-sensitive bicupin YhaK (pirin superfamily)